MKRGFVRGIRFIGVQVRFDSKQFVETVEVGFESVKQNMDQLYVDVSADLDYIILSRI